jgi:hypothetical protein
MLMVLCSRWTTYSCKHTWEWMQPGTPGTSLPVMTELSNLFERGALQLMLLAYYQGASGFGLHGVCHFALDSCG